MSTIRNIITSFVIILLTGCTKTDFTIQDLKKVLPYTSYETVTSIPELAILSEETTKYRVNADNMTCYFPEEKRSSLIIPDGSVDLLKYILSNEQFDEVMIKYEKFQKDKNVVASTYYYGSYEVWLIYDNSGTSCIQVYM